MKRLQFFLVALLSIGCVTTGKAQSDDSGLTVGLSFGIGQERAFYGTHHETNSGVIVTPRIGYRFNEKWEAGAFFKYQKFGKYQNYYGIGGYGEYDALKIVDNLSLFIDMKASYSFLNSSADGVLGESGIAEIGFVPGLKYRIPGSPVDVKFRYLFVGFNHSGRDYKAESPGCLGRGDWIIDAGLRRFELGVALNF